MLTADGKPAIYAVLLNADGTPYNPGTGGGGGGGGGAVTIADGADVAQGTTTDVAGANTVLGQSKALVQAATSTSPVTVSWSGQTIALAAGSASIGNIGNTAFGISGTLPAFASPPALGAAEAHLGEVGGNIAKIAVSFGPSSSTTYTTGQVLLGATALAGASRVANGTGYLFGATLGLNAANTVQVDLFVFSSQPTGTYTAGTTFTLAAADLTKLSKVIHLDDWTAAGAALSFGQPLDKGPRLFRCDDATATSSLWVVAVARGSIVLASATDGALTLRAARN